MKETLKSAGKAGLFVAGATLVCRAVLSAADFVVEKAKKKFNERKQGEEQPAK